MPVYYLHVTYLLEQDRERRNQVVNLLKQGHFISTQVVAENVNVCLKKLKMSKEAAFGHASLLMEAFNIIQITENTLHTTFHISVRYQFSFWDSLIVATALESACSILYSEDLQHLMVIEERLTVINPFLS